MSFRPTRWLIELRPADPLRETLVLHVYDDDTHDWQADKTRALRFAAKHEAERFGSDHLDEAFEATEHQAAELVGVVDHDFQDEAESLAC